MLLGMLKPFLPKLEGFLHSNKELEVGEQAKIVMDIVNNQIHIQIIAFKLIDPKDQTKGFNLRVLQDIKADEL